VTGPDAEKPLTGGATRTGVVRVGDTVRRPRTDRSTFVEAVLRRLAAASVAGVPRWLGIDEQGRDVLSYQPGGTGHDVAAWSDDQLAEVARLVRRMHDALAGSPEAGSAGAGEAGGAETVCHNDIAPWNTILDGDVPVGLIDFDDAAPGRRIEDVAYLAWVFGGLGPAGPDIEEQVRLIRVVCAAYTGDRPLPAEPIERGFVDALLAQHDRISTGRRLRAAAATDTATRSFNTDRAAEIDRSRDWLQARRDTLDRLAP
jgi:Ser/Thr protein kinase RdoA (MazF antagonist)